MYSDKSHVSMEQKVCPVCGNVFDSGAILLHKRLSQVLDRHTVTGYDLCVDCKKLKDDGYIALVEIKNDNNQANVKLEKADRTGIIAHIRCSAWPMIFGTSCPKEDLVFVEVGLIDKLKEMEQR